MKILHITNNYPTEKLPIFGVFVKEQIDTLTELGIENDVFFINGREKGKFEYIRCLIPLKKKIKENNYDVIHCHHAFSGIVATLFLKIQNQIPVVISFQNDPANEAKYNLFDLLSTRTSAWIFKNNSIYAKPPKGYYLPNGVDIDFFKSIPRKQACEKLNIDPSNIYILFVSSNYIRKQKRYDKFLAVMELLNKKYGLNNIEELKITNVQRELVPYYFNAASVHLMTSDFEGSPNSVKEAMACNIPVVSTNVGNVSDLLADVNGSFVVNSGEIEDLALHVIKSLNTSDYNSRTMLIQKKLDIKSVAIKLNNIYQSLI